MPKTIADYIKAEPALHKKRLKEILACARQGAPKASEALKWGMPTLSYTRILLSFAAFKNHVSIFPGTDAIKKFSKELKKYPTSPGTIQFPLDKPIPKRLVTKIAKFRAKLVLEKDVKWMTRDKK